jgi:hypothetical protein
MQICGWKTRSMFDRYDIKNEDDLRDAAAQIAMIRVLGGKPRVMGRGPEISPTGCFGSRVFPARSP